MLKSERLGGPPGRVSEGKCFRKSREPSLQVAERRATEEKPGLDADASFSHSQWSQETLSW